MTVGGGSRPHLPMVHSRPVRKDRNRRVIKRDQSIGCARAAGGARFPTNTDHIRQSSTGSSLEPRGLWRANIHSAHRMLDAARAHNDRCRPSRRIARQRRPKRGAQNQAIGRSRAGARQKSTRSSTKDGRPTAFLLTAARRRHQGRRIVARGTAPSERLIGDKGLRRDHLKDFRAIATRYDKTAQNFLAGLWPHHRGWSIGSIVSPDPRTRSV